MRKLIASVLVVTTASGCATGAVSSTLGRKVTVIPGDAEGQRPVAGELIAVEPDRLWVLGKEHVVQVPMASVAEVRVERHGMSTGRGLAWAGIGALTTGGALMAACGSVEGEDDCGWVFLGVGLTWLVLGALPALGLDKSATTRLRQPAPQALSRFARFPQGPPEGVDLLQLPPKPEKKTEK
jgi:hypothetical protein